MVLSRKGFSTIVAYELLNTVNGAPLTLEFRKIFLRQAIPPLENDFTFTAQELLAFATNLWAGLQ